MSAVMTSFYFLALAAPFLHVAAAPPHSVRNVNIPYAESANTVELQFHIGSGQPTKPLSQRLERRTVLDTDGPRNSASLYPLAQAYVVPTKVGTQNLLLLLDTGSADTWVADAYYRCGQGPQTYCEMGQSFELKSCDASARTISDVHFDLGYADGSHASGPMMHADLSLAPSIKFTQEMGLAQYIYWQGGYNVTSGVLGLAHSAMTQKFHGTDISGYGDISCPLNGSTIVYDYYGKPHTCNQITYTGVAENLNSSFTLALARGSKEHLYGGSITFGGVPKSTSPNINVTGQYVTVPMETLDYIKTDTLTYHVISVDGIQIPLTYNSTAALPSTPSSYVRSTKAAAKRDVLRRSNSGMRYASKRSATNSQFRAMSNGTSGKAQFIIDSGTAVNFFPAPIAKAINQLFQPPTFVKYSGGTTFVNCTDLEYVPSVAIKIGGVDFLINPEDMVIREQDYAYDPESGAFVKTEICISAIQDALTVDRPSGTVLNILGQSFLKNVMMTFDMSNEQIGLVSRPFYSSSPF